MGWDGAAEVGRRRVWPLRRRLPSRPSSAPSALPPAASRCLLPACPTPRCHPPETTLECGPGRLPSGHASGGGTSWNRSPFGRVIGARNGRRRSEGWRTDLPPRFRIGPPPDQTSSRPCRVGFGGPCQLRSLRSIYCPKLELKYQ